MEKFVAALTQADVVIKCIPRQELVLHRLIRDRALTAFLDHSGPEKRQAAFEAARKALVPPEPEPAWS